jgi:hypothetical protein
MWKKEEITLPDLENGQDMQICQEYIFLCINTCKRGNHNVEINCRITQAHKAKNALNFVW